MNKKVEVRYLLSSEGQKKSILAGGNGKRLQTFTVDATPRLVKLARVSSDGDLILEVGFSTLNKTIYPVLVELELRTYSQTFLSEPVLSKNQETHYFDDLQDIEPLLLWEENRLAKIESQRLELEPLYEKLLAEYKKERAKRDAENAKTMRERKEWEARERAEEEKRSQARKIEREKWIATSGSQYLKDATSLGYDCQRVYVKERAEAEFPGFEVDFDNESSYNERVSPSPEALSEAKGLVENGINARIVWLTCPHIYEDCFEPQEAIVVENFLGEYTLIKYL